MEATKKKSGKKKSNLSFGETKTMKSLGAYIKAEREKQGLSLEQLSEKAFANPHTKKTISEIERGLVSEVKFITIVRIFNGLDISLGF